MSSAEGPQVGTRELGTKPAPPCATYLKSHLHPFLVKTEPSTLAPGSEERLPALGPVFGQATVLPCHLQDLLALPKEQGPSMEGIFWLGAGKRTSQQLREALDSGMEVNLQNQPAHLVAVILKVNSPDLERSSSGLFQC